MTGSTYDGWPRHSEMDLVSGIADTVGTLAASTMARAGTRGVASWGEFDARVVQPRGLLFRLPGDDQEEAYES